MEDNRGAPELPCSRPKNWKLDRMGQPPTPEKIEKQRPEQKIPERPSRAYLRTARRLPRVLPEARTGRARAGVGGRDCSG